MAQNSSMSDTARGRIAAVVLLVVITLLVVLALAMFNRAFTPTRSIVVRAERSGLVLDKDAKVKARGVDIGRVKNVSEDLGGAIIELEVYPQDLEELPADSAVSISSNTIFGAKSVNFDPGAGSMSGPSLKPGDTIDVENVTTEVNSLYENLSALLVTLEPEKLNATIGAIAGALDGRGEDLGNTITELNAYLKKMNPSLETLGRDLSKTSKVTDIYAKATPDIMRILDNGTSVGNNLVRNQAQFEQLLARAIQTGEKGEKLLDEHGNDLVKSLRDLRATTSLGAEYSPSLTCLIVGLNQGVQDAGYAFGAENQPGLVFNAGFQLGAKPYEPIKDLPKVNASTGPNCWGLPFLEPGEHAPYVVTDIGTNTMAGQPWLLRDKPNFQMIPGKPAPPLILSRLLGPELAELDGGS